ncbi:MAG: hypothetical protein JXA71_18240 [Chitinispirillaceae bacterium]|nr:hypothetical protein [Chitinispirillaceae bacterium]
MKRLMAAATAALAMALFGRCVLTTHENDTLAYAGYSAITRLDVEAFGVVARFSPASSDSFRLVGQDPVAGVLETMAIYKKVRWDPEYFFLHYGRPWQWKRRYLTSRMYAIDVLQKRLGHTDAELRRYYDDHQKEFRKEGDTGISGENKILPFDSVWFGVARKLFQTTYAPDSGSPDLNGSGAFHRFLTDGYQDYFLKKFYREKYGKPFPQVVRGAKEIKGLIHEKDLRSAAVILAPQERRAFEKDPAPFTRSLAQWKLFSDRATSSGFLDRHEVKKTLAWAWKIEVAQRYINDHLVPETIRSAPVDTAMARFSWFDKVGNIERIVDTPAWKNHLTAIARAQMTITYDSLIFPLRRGLRVRFIQSEWRDEKGQDPELLATTADSLHDAGNESEAATAYSILAANYVFTPQGTRALFELAAIQAEKPEYCNEAIANYRRYLMRTRDVIDRSRAMFAVGFIYDRYLGQPGLAEVNYQWVLKNAPGSPLAGDAEVMLHYLGEPMPGSDELREDALRRGARK